MFEFQFELSINRNFIWFYDFIGSPSVEAQRPTVGKKANRSILIGIKLTIEESAEKNGGA